MNILVTGANGQLGNCIRNAATNSPHNYHFTDVNELDITNADAVSHFVQSNDINAIINCAAFTNVDAAETNIDLARRLNATAVNNLAQAAKSNDAALLHFSTDYVFGGNQGNTPRREDDPTNPTGVYGVTKLEGEKMIEQSGCHYLIFRTAWLYSEYGKNFVKTMLNLTANRPELKVVFDQVGSPTYAQDLANTIIAIIDSNKIDGNEGIYHFSNEGVCSWFDFTKSIAKMAGNTNCDIQPCHSSEFPSPVERPAYSVLDKTKVKETFGITVPYWVDSLQTCIRNLEKTD